MRLTSLNQLIWEGKTLQGKWRLNRRHELEYRRLRPVEIASRASGQRRREEELLLTGELMAAEPTGLVFRVLERSVDGGVTHRLLTLRGRWQADAKNRLTFLAQRERGREDRLTFGGSWQVGKENELLYRFDRLDLKRKQRRRHTLVFRGHWDLDGTRRLAYVLEGASDSAFRFRGAFQSGSLLAKEGTLRYQVGVELEGKRRLKTITLFGKWKLSKDLSVEFEMPFSDGSARSLEFGATYAIGANSDLLGRLTTRQGKPLGVELVLTKGFLKGQGEAFVRLKRTLEETAIEGGARFRW